MENTLFCQTAKSFVGTAFLLLLDSVTKFWSFENAAIFNCSRDDKHCANLSRGVSFIRRSSIRFRVKIDDCCVANSVASDLSKTEIYPGPKLHRDLAPFRASYRVAFNIELPFYHGDQLPSQHFLISLS